MRQKILAGLAGLSVSLGTVFAGNYQPIFASPQTRLLVAPIAQSSEAQDPEVLFQQGLRQTQKQDFRGAIANLEKAAILFTQDLNLELAYKSQALAAYLTWDLKDTSPPNWYNGGGCLGEPVCQYIVTHVSPNLHQNPYGGILMLLKPIRYRPSSTGGQTPVNAVLDVQIIPQLKQEEYVHISSCMLDRKQDGEIVAVVKIAPSDRDAELFTKILQAWRINLKTEKIETIPTKGITCINPCPGGC